MKFQKIMSVLALVGICFNTNTVLNCVALDMSHGYHEELELLEKELVYRRCSDDGGCEKYLIRYDGVSSLIEQLKKVIKENNDILINLKIIAEKAGVAGGLIGTGLGFYFRPFQTSLAVLGTGIVFPMVCTVYNDLTKPVGETVSFVTTAVIKLKKWFFKENTIKNADKGMIGNLLDVLCGNDSQENFNYGLVEFIRRLFFGEISKEELEKVKNKAIYSQILSDLYEKIDKREYEVNNIIVISTDFTNLTNARGKLIFDKTRINLNYERPIDDYFKNIKT